jgi:5-hydroxyisourate hydrolase
MGLTTHVLDTANGGPAAGVRVRLYGLDGERALLASTETNADGRTDAPLVDDGELTAGTYEIEFDVGPYFGSRDFELGEPPFLDTVVIRVSLAAGQHYHVPLLVSPWSYSTYRGS